MLNVSQNGGPAEEFEVAEVGKDGSGAGRGEGEQVGG